MLSERILDGRLKLRHLVLAVTIADAGTVIEAARQLHVTQPVVSRGLHDLERALEVDLFERRPRGVVPTPVGEMFISRARRIISELREVGAQLDLIGPRRSGLVRVGIHLAGKSSLLPRAIAALKAEHPHFTVEVRQATPERLYEYLRTGSIDLIVGRLRENPPAGLIQHRLLSDPVRLTVRRDHPAIALKDLALKDLTGFPWILPVRETALRTELENAFAAQGLDLPVDRVECSDEQIVRDLVLASDAVAAIPAHVVESDDVVELGVEFPTVLRAVGITVAGHDEPVPAAREFIAALRGAASAFENETQITA